MPSMNSILRLSRTTNTGCEIRFMPEHKTSIVRPGKMSGIDHRYTGRFSLQYLQYIMPGAGSLSVWARGQSDFLRGSADVAGYSRTVQ